jgi:hypothetical protein
LAAAIALGQQAVQRLAFYLGHRVPHRHVDGAYGHRAFAVPAGLFVGHHRGPHAVWVEVVALRVAQRVWRGRTRVKHARDEALAHQRALAVAAVGVEAVADHRFAVAHHVGDDGHQAQRHLREVDVRVADGRTDGPRGFADLDDFHGVGVRKCVRVQRGSEAPPQIWIS